MLCKYCHYEFYVAADSLGSKVRCPNCTATVNVVDKQIICPCPECGGMLDISIWMLGSSSRCPHCQKNIVLSLGEDSSKYLPESPAHTEKFKTASHKAGDMVGKYRIIRCLGIGGMGEVYLGEHTLLNHRCALKLLKHDIAKDDPEIRARLLREARLASQIQHKNLISVLDMELDENTSTSYIAMEYVDGVSIESILVDGPMLESRALEIVIEVAEALKVAAEHKIIHRDIKPANIMLSRTGDVKVADLGIAKVESDGKQNMTLTMDNAVLGTPNYASPEQLRSSHQVDCRADIYSLGATLYHMLTGKRPFEAESIFGVMCNVLDVELPMVHTVNPEISLKTSELISRMMAKKRDERPNNFDELLKELNSNKKIHLNMLFKKRLKKVLSSKYVWIAVSVIMLLAGAWLTAKMFYESKKGADPVIKVVKVPEKPVENTAAPKPEPEIAPKPEAKPVVPEGKTEIAPKPEPPEPEIAPKPEVVVPKEIFQFSSDGKTLVKCLDSNVKKAEIPAGVISIGDRAFMHCRDLSEVVLPDGVTRIGDFAFSDCRNLKELKLPDSVQTISQSAFAGCNNLTLTLSVNLKEIQSNAFDAVKQVLLPSSNRHLKSDAQGVIISADQSELIFVPWNIAEYTVPDGVKKLRNNIFDSRRQLHKIQLPSSLSYIGTQAFAQCDSLTELVIPDSVTELGFNVLSNCANLKQLTIPEHLQEQLDRFNISIDDVKVTVKSDRKTVEKSASDKDTVENKHVGDFVLSKDGKTLIKCTNKNIVNAVIPHGVTKIERNAFEKCRSLKTITVFEHLKSMCSRLKIPESCKIKAVKQKTIRSGDFLLSEDGTILVQCSNKKIKKAVIPKGVKILQLQAFRECRNLTQVVLPQGLIEIQKNAFYECLLLKKVTIPNTVTDIGGGAFLFCHKLKVNIPPSVKNIGGGAFSSVKQAVLEKGNRYYKVDSYGAIVKNDNTELIFVPRTVRRYEIPRGVKVISLDMFNSCFNLTDIKIPDTVEKINNYAFFGCRKLKQIQLPGSVNFIGTSAFAYCASLNKITIPESVRTIGTSAFSFCVNLNRLVIPDSVEKIGTEVFFKCMNLKYLRLPANLRKRKPELSIPDSTKVVFR